MHDEGKSCDCIGASQPIESTSKALTLISDGPYVEQMAAALSNERFSVIGPVLPGKAYSTRYGFRFYIQTGQVFCIFTDSIIGDASLTIVDLQSGGAIAVFKQTGATGPCSSVDPVYPGIAAEVSKLWSTSNPLPKIPAN